MDLLSLQNGSDIRGIAAEGVEGEHVNLTPQAARQIGCAYVSWLARKIGVDAEQLHLGVGRDSRTTGPELADALMAGMVSAGATVTDCGMATTPAMFMSIVFPETAFNGAAMITASHLPANRNGIKFFDEDGGLEHGDITEVLRLAALLAPSRVQATVAATDLLSLYAEHLRTSISGAFGGDAQPLRGLHIVVDAGNGAGGFFVEKVLSPLGADTSGSRFLEPDGRFPNHVPNPENKAAMEAIRGAVLESHADLGLIFDTDVDRMSAVLADGSEVNRDAIIALMAAILAPRYPGSTIITDSVTSDRLTFFLQDVLGLRHLRYMRGYKNVINKQKELNAAGTCAPLAMETSGHGALKENHYLDDGAFLAVQLVIALARAAAEGKKLDSLIERLPPPGEEGEYRLRIRCADFKAYGATVLEQFRARAQGAGYGLPQSYEGVRVCLAEGWMLLRMSLHDPVMPLNMEATVPGGLARLKQAAQELTSGFDQLDCTPLRS